MIKSFYAVVLLNLAISSLLYARPQYAVRKKTVKCNLCHISPTGGGPRNLYGKTFDRKGMGLGVYSKNDIISGDFRAVGFYPTKDTSKSANGMGLMNAAVGVNLPIVQNSDGSELRAVAVYDMGTVAALSSPARDAYVRYQTDSSGGFAPTHFIFGRFNTPFGMVTDEHRTYTRMQNQSSILNQSFGMMMSGDPSYLLHYDIAMTNGFGNKGTFGNADITWAHTSNLRWNPFDSPIFIGASFDYHKSNNKLRSPWAISLYAAIDFHVGTLITEFVEAQYWNDDAINTKISKFVDKEQMPGLYNDIQYKKSLGNYSRLDISLTKRLNLVYKFELLALDKSYISDYYMRNGVGFDYAANTNTDLSIRFEKASIGRAGVPETKVYTTQDILILIARIWI